MTPKLKPETLEERKTQILSAAMTCFSRKGYHQTTMDDIVEKAGLSKGGVYWHFGSKKELFLSLVDSLIGGTEEMMLASMAAKTSAREKLRAMHEASRAMATADEFKEMMPLFLDVWAQNVQDCEVNELAHSMYDRFRAPLVEVIEEGVASGEFKPVDANALASILFALYDGLAVQAMIDESLVDWDAVDETLTKTLIAGLLTNEKA